MSNDPADEIRSTDSDNFLEPPNDELERFDATPSDTKSSHQPDDDQHETAPNKSACPSILWLTALVEGGLLVLALVLGGILSFHDPRQPLAEILDWPWLSATVFGTMAAIPALILAMGLPKMRWNWSRSFSTKVERLVIPLFAGISVPGLAWISICAGVGEEMLFRWCLQGGLESLFTFPGGWLIALIVASIVFGILHWVDRTYAILATLAGLYFGALMLASGTVLVPIIAHAIYDFVVLLWLTRIRAKQIDPTMNRR